MSKTKYKLGFSLFSIVAIREKKIDAFEKENLSLTLKKKVFTIDQLNYSSKILVL